jgi:glycosyltransferase involved in cell wall biosynthesis
MTFRPPRLSIVIPAHNAARYLREAVASVVREAGNDAEIIVVDDASQDESAAIAESLAGQGVHCLRRARQGGAGAARNQGVAAARGTYLAFLDADDLWPAGRLARLTAALDGAGRPTIAFGHVQHFFSPDMPIEARRQWHCPALPMPGYLTGAMVLRRADFQAIGPFEEDFVLGELIGWLARARELGFAPMMLKEVVLERRIHGANLSITRRAEYSGYAVALKRVLDRRRKADS